MATSAGIALRPYFASVAPRVCECRTESKDLGRFKRLEKAVDTIGGYWNVYLAFFGEQQLWLEFTVTDLRDGRLLWRNGHFIREEDNAKSNEHETGSAGGRAERRSGEWIIGSRDPFLR